MTVKELKKRLEKVPDDLKVYFGIESWDGEFDVPVDDYGIINNARIVAPGEALWTQYFASEDSDLNTKRSVLLIKGQSFYYLGNQED